MSRIVCQMYGFRKEIEKDPFTCFQKVKEIGFDKIQLDGMRGRDPLEIKEAIDKAGLTVSSMHIKHDRFIHDVDGIIKEGELFGCKEVYLKYIDDEYQVESGYLFTKYALIKAAKKLQAAGFEVGFHSPEYDFNNMVNGLKVMDFICQEEEGIAIHPEPDTYWLSVAGVDPAQYCKKYAGRILTIHMKDIDTSLDLNDMQNNLRECGKGDVNFFEIMKWGYENNVRSFAIEQDFSKTNMYESMQESFNYLSKLEEEIVCKK